MGEKAVFSLKKGLYLFLILSASTAILIVYFTMDEGTWACLARVRYTYILAILGLILAGWSFDALRLRTLVASLGNRISFIKSLGIVLSGIFAAAVTPSHMGGGIVQVYMLFREGVPIGNGWALSFIKLMLDLLVLAVIVSFGFLLLPNLLLVVPFKWVFVLPSLAVVISLYYLLRDPTRLKGIARTVIGVLGKIGLINKGRVEAVSEMAFQEVDNFYHTLLGQSRTRRTPLFLALAYTALIITSRFMVAPVLMAGLGFQMSIIRAFWLQAVLMLGLFIVPTPGGSGVAELGFAALFGPVVSPSLLGVYTILWRFFTNFLAVAVGGVMVIKFLGFQWVEENKTQPIVEEEMATSK